MLFSSERKSHANTSGCISCYQQIYLSPRQTGLTDIAIDPDITCIVDVKAQARIVINVVPIPAYGKLMPAGACIICIVLAHSRTSMKIRKERSKPLLYPLSQRGQSLTLR